MNDSKFFSFLAIPSGDAMAATLCARRACQEYENCKIARDHIASNPAEWELADQQMTWFKSLERGFLFRKAELEKQDA